MFRFIFMARAEMEGLTTFTGREVPAAYYCSSLHVTLFVAYASITFQR